MKISIFLTKSGRKEDLDPFRLSNCCDQCHHIISFRSGNLYEMINFCPTAALVAKVRLQEFLRHYIDENCLDRFQFTKFGLSSPLR